jgi:hypothetical protein
MRVTEALPYSGFTKPLARDIHNYKGGVDSQHGGEGRKLGDSIDDLIVRREAAHHRHQLDMFCIAPQHGQSRWMRAAMPCEVEPKKRLHGTCGKCLR